MNSLFDSAGLAIVAYVEVLGATGTSTNTNSGVTTTRTSTGSYRVTLPAYNTQNGARDLIFVQGKTSSGVPLAGNLVSPYVDDNDGAIKKIQMVTVSGGVSSLVDSDFSVLILRTIVPPPADAPA
jgi:hypothetical protein